MTGADIWVLDVATRSGGRWCARCSTKRGRASRPMDDGSPTCRTSPAAGKSIVRAADGDGSRVRVSSERRRLAVLVARRPARCTSARAAGRWPRRCSTARRCRRRRRSAFPAPMRWCSPAAPPPAIASCAPGRRAARRPRRAAHRPRMVHVSSTKRRDSRHVDRRSARRRISPYRQSRSAARPRPVRCRRPAGRAEADRSASLGDRLDPADAAGRGRLDRLLPTTSAPVYLASQEVMNEHRRLQHSSRLPGARQAPGDADARSHRRRPAVARARARRREQSRQRRRPVPQRRRVRHRARRARARTAAIRCIERRSARRWARRCRVPFVHAPQWPGAIADLRTDGFTVVALTPALDRRAARRRAPGRRSSRCWSGPRARV